MTFDPLVIDDLGAKLYSTLPPIISELIANGYDDKGVWRVDSHHQHYKYKRKKYKKGFYKISWENLLTCMGQGDIILPDDYYIIE